MSSFCRLIAGWLQMWAIISPSCVPDSYRTPGYAPSLRIVHVFCPYCGGHKFKIDTRQLGVVEVLGDRLAAGTRPME